MKEFTEMTKTEMESVDGGGFLASIAGGIAGAMLGAFVGLIPSLVTGDTSYIKKSVITGASVGVWAGAGAPTP